MDTNEPETPESGWQYAGENMRRRKTSGMYYVFAKRNGKQFSHSLKTTDKPTARRLKDNYLRELSRLSSAEAAQITFEQLAAAWTASERHTLKESSADRRVACVKAIAPAFLGLQIRNITTRHCEAWAITRAKDVASATFVKELETIRGAFRYAKAHGLVIHDPSENVKRPTVRNKPPKTPTREQFVSIVAAIRSEPQGKGAEGALLVELLAYSGMRLNEARSLRWRDVNFAQGVFTVTGGERGTKNHDQRTVAMSDEMRDLLTRLKRTRGKSSPDAFIIKTSSARKCLETACHDLGLPLFHHHSLRHYFASCAMEQCPDVRAVADWLGHKDGGALLLKRYAHTRQTHSIEQMKRVNFRSPPPSK